MVFLLSLFFTLAPAFAADHHPKRDDSSCARMELAAIYGAEKSYESEYERYEESFDEIGFSPEPGECTSWTIGIRLFNGAREFLATAEKAETGETWTINEKKDLRQESAGSAAKK